MLHHGKLKFYLAYASDSYLLPANVVYLLDQIFQRHKRNGRGATRQVSDLTRKLFGITGKEDISLFNANFKTTWYGTKSSASSGTKPGQWTKVFSHP